MQVYPWRIVAPGGVDNDTRLDSKTLAVGTVKAGRSVEAIAGATPARGLLNQCRQWGGPMKTTERSCGSSSVQVEQSHTTRYRLSPKGCDTASHSR